MKWKANLRLFDQSFKGSDGNALVGLVSNVSNDWTSFIP